MSTTSSDKLPSTNRLRWSALARNVSFWLLIAIVAWAPFPLGSNREWSWSIIAFALALCWAFWAIWILTNMEVLSLAMERLWIAASLAAGVLTWAVVQAEPLSPPGWVHPIWPMAENLIGRPIAGTVSLNPWRTLSEAAKLLSYLLTAFMIFTLSQNTLFARRLTNAVITIGALYAAHAFGLKLIGRTQYSFFYSTQATSALLSGPFALHNSFATFEGLTVLSSVARLVELAGNRIITSRGIRRWLMSSLKFTFGAGLPIILATILTVSALVASASRGGFFSTILALFCMALGLGYRLWRKMEWRWLLVGTASLITLLVALIWIGGDALNSRIIDLIDTDNSEATRLALWSAAFRMVSSAPWSGLGLGTFQDAYPMYATKLLPFIMDKAHCDYLEFAAGLGLPAAISWWGAISLCVAQMTKGTLQRRKDHIYPLVGIGSTILVGAHSIVDFSLQIPSVALTYTALFAAGLAQSYPSKTTNPIVAGLSRKASVALEI